MNLRYTLIALFLLLFTLIIAISVQVFISDTCQVALGSIADVLTTAKCGQYSECIHQLNDLIKMLNNRKIVFAIVLNHSYLDSIVSSLTQATICARFEDLPSLELELSSAACTIASLAARDLPTLGNIF